MGENGFMKAVAHIDYQNRNMLGYFYGRLIMSPNITGEVGRPKNWWPEGFKFRKGRKSPYPWYNIKKAECYPNNKAFNNNYCNYNCNNYYKESTENSHIRHSAHTAEIAEVKLQNLYRRT